MTAPAGGAQRYRILVIKHGALGDFVMALGPFQAIRQHHEAARITLLTTAPFKDFAEASGYFDEVWVDPRPKLGGWRQILALRRRLLEARFDRVYDLQTSSRTGWYFRLLPRRRRPEWSGIARGCSHPQPRAGRRGMHTIERQREQLRIAGIAEVPFPRLDWAARSAAVRRPEGRYALLVPGGAAHRPGKRWPVGGYAALAGRLAASGVIPVVIGGAGERDLARAIVEACGEALDLTGRTSFADIAHLAQGAALAIGNDTGPMHIAAIAGARSVVLFSGESDPKRTAPRGPAVTVLRASPLPALPLDEVWAAAGLGPMPGPSP